MRRLLLLGLAALACVACELSRRDSSAAPAVSRARSAAEADVFPYSHHTDDLANGLRLITVPTDHAGVVSVYIVVSVGSRDEIEEGKSGFAHFFEHMMFRGSENFSSDEQARIFKAAGADRNAYTTDDYTCYHTTFSTRDLEQVLEVEADRFQRLTYAEPEFRTEAMAILGEYNTSSASPFRRMYEKARATAFREHTYRHTTLGFLADIKRMPRLYDYSREFFRQHYRPDNTTILIVGDVDRDQTQSLVDRYWGDWRAADVARPGAPAAEPRQTEPLRCHVEWPAPISPWLMISFKGPAFSTTRQDMAVLDVINSLAFSENSELYKQLYVRDGLVDLFTTDFGDHTDPYLLSIMARVKRPADVARVEAAILEACARIGRERVAAKDIERTVDHLEYGFVSALDSPNGIASSLAGYLGRARSIDAVNAVYRLYDQVTPQAVQEVARQYFVADRRTVTTLSHEPLPAASPAAEPEARDLGDPEAIAEVLVPTSSPLVSFRVLFDTGAIHDPAGKEGVAHVTAQLLAGGGTERLTYEQLVERLYPMAASVDVQVDKEMTVFSGTVHRDNAEEFWGILRQMLLEPAFNVADFERVKADTIAYLDNGLRRTDEEELGKEVLYQEIYAGHPYGHHNAGAISAVAQLTIDDVRKHYLERFTAGAVTLGLAGGFERSFPARIRADLAAGLPATSGAPAVAVAQPAPPDRNRLTIVQKPMTGTGIHIGFPIAVERSDPDWPALWLARSWLGEHRSENSHLYQRLRELRGLNYGDYAYIEYFPRGPQQFHPDPNLARQSQIFQIWLRPVQPANGPFALKAALFELRKLIDGGLSQAAFEATRTYLSKYANLLVQTQDRRLGYALDSRYYGIGDFAQHVGNSLERLTVDDVNRVIRKHLRGDRLQIVVVTEDAETFRDQILNAQTPTPAYVSQPSEDVLAEDHAIQWLTLEVRPEDVKIVPVDRVFQ